MHALTMKILVTTYPVQLMGMHPFLPKTRLAPNVRNTHAVRSASTPPTCVLLRGDLDQLVEIRELMLAVALEG